MERVKYLAAHNYSRVKQLATSAPGLPRTLTQLTMPGGRRSFLNGQTTPWGSSHGEWHLQLVQPAAP